VHDLIRNTRKFIFPGGEVGSAGKEKIRRRAARRYDGIVQRAQLRVEKCVKESAASPPAARSASGPGTRRQISRPVSCAKQALSSEKLQLVKSGTVDAEHEKSGP